MKRFLITVAVAVVALGINSAMAWGKFGHEIVIEVAKRHITEKTKANIAKYMPYNITDDAIYMDIHRDDKEIGYTTAWHVYNVDEKYEYDMNPRLYKGDAILAMKVVDHNLTKQERLTDSAIVMNIRCLLHFAGDMHCPSHCKFIDGRDDAAPKVYIKGKRMGSFHGLYDSMPEHIYGWKKDPAELAAELDTYSKGKIKRTCKGSHHDWAKECMRITNVIHQWNPNDGTKDLRDDTIELSKDVIDIQLRHAGYRLAYLLNKYFGE